jgi:hypothetical protein
MGSKTRVLWIRRAACVFWMSTAILSTACAQGGATLHDTTDVEGWLTFKLNIKLADALQLDLVEQARWMENLAVFERQFHQAAFSWSPDWNDLSDAQYLAVGARHTTELDNSGGKQGFERFLRLFAHYGGKAELSRWELAWRLAYQRTQALFLAGGDDPLLEPIKVKWRYRLTVAYDFENWDADPELSYEYFPDAREKLTWLWPKPRHRWRLATDLKIDKRNHIKCFLQRHAGPELFPGALRTEVRWAIGFTYAHRSKRK